MQIPNQAYTVELKELAVKQIKDGQSISMACKEPVLGEQTLRH